MMPENEINDKTLSDKDMANIIGIWQKVIDVEMHFNNIEMTIRNLDLTLLTFILGAIGFCFKESFFIMILGFALPVSSVIALIGVIIIWSFYFMDKHWYHRYLKASVDKAVIIEKNIKKFYPGIDLSAGITQRSHISNIFLRFFKIEIDSNKKITIFYAVQIIILLACSIFLQFSSNKGFLITGYNSIRNESVRIVEENTNSISGKPGLIISLNSDSSLYFVKESGNLYKDFNNLSGLYLSASNINLIHDKKTYYKEILLGRKELEEMVKNKGIVINPAE